MPNLAVNNFNVTIAVLGGFITVFGLVSYLLKEKFYLSEALISTFAGLVFSPHALNFIRPLQYANGNELDLETITLYFSRLVLGVQLVLAGVQLPSKYLRTEWRSLTWLLGPGMCIMWLTTSLMVWALVPHIGFLFALAIGACVTPTDPILSNSIVKGKFADKNIPRKLQRLIIAESGANDGLGYPFLFLALYLIRHTRHHGLGAEGGARTAIGLWFGESWGYTILLSVVYGATVGWIAKELLHWAEERHYVDRESFLVFAITLALFIVGTVGMIGSDDVLACFIAGNVFTWDDWFRLETEDDSLQPTIDMLLNVSVFMWYGAVCPWHKFLANDVVPIYRLIPLGIMVLLFRRLPMVLTYYYFGLIHQVDNIRHACFVGFFGPIGVSAIFYVYIAREFLAEIVVDGQEREDATHLAECIDVVVWFLVICSIVVHGLSVPLGKLFFYLPRTITTAISSERGSASQSRAASPGGGIRPEQYGVNNSEHNLLPFRRRHTTSERGPAVPNPASITWVPKIFVRAGKHIIDDIRRPNGAHSHVARVDGENSAGSDGRSAKGMAVDGSAHPEISLPTNPRLFGHNVAPPSGGPSGLSAPQSPVVSGTSTPTGFARPPRTIQFADQPTSTKDMP